MQGSTLAPTTPKTKSMINQTILNKMQAIQAEQLAKATKVQPIFTAPKKEITDAKEIIETFKLVPKVEDTPPLNYFTILWHEGRHIEGATFEGAIFTNWQDVQSAFFKLWEVNEKGQDGGYTKVKCTIKLEGKQEYTARIDITNKINNGDFNPNSANILIHLQDDINAMEDEIQDETPELSTLTFDEIVSNLEETSAPAKEDEQEINSKKDEIIKTLQELVKQQEAIIVNLKTQLLEATATEIKPCKPVVSINHEKNGIEIKFDCKPSQSTLDLLKSNGFRWSKYNSIWYNVNTAENLNFANSL